MDMKITITRQRASAIGALFYIVFTFFWAVAWHVGLFYDRYAQFGYFTDQPNFAFGLAAIAVQGALLSWGYFWAYVKFGAHLSAWRFSFFVGGFYWTCHVIAQAAKTSQAANVVFIGMETFYLSIQFGAFAVVLNWLVRRVIN